MCVIEYYYTLTPMCWCISDKPEAPESLKVSDVFADRCKLKWDSPSDDGGGEIMGKHALTNIVL